MRWYVVHAYSGFEKKVAESIREQVEKKGLSAHFGEILVPVETVVDIQKGKIEKGSIEKIIASCNRENAGVTAEPQGLYLNKVFY